MSRQGSKIIPSNDKSTVAVQRLDQLNQQINPSTTTAPSWKKKKNGSAIDAPSDILLQSILEIARDGERDAVRYICRAPRNTFIGP